MEKKKREQKPERKKQVFLLVGFYVLFVVLSYVFKVDAGIKIGQNFIFFAKDMLLLFPPAFILVGLFMVWIKRETVERYFGESSGLMGFVMAILLACTTLYPFVVALPMAAALNQKGARLGIVLTYIGATAVCRVPMTIFEATFLGVQFSVIRYIVSLPLIVISALIMETILGKDHLVHHKVAEDLE